MISSWLLGGSDLKSRLNTRSSTKNKQLIKRGVGLGGVAVNNLHQKKDHQEHGKEILTMHLVHLNMKSEKMQD